MHIVTERVGGCGRDWREWCESLNSANSRQRAISDDVDKPLKASWNSRGEKKEKDATLNGRVSRRLLSSSIFQLPFTLVVGGKDGCKNMNVLFSVPRNRKQCFHFLLLSSFSSLFLNREIESIGRENNERFVDNQSQPFFFPPALASSSRSSLLLPTKVKILKR